MSGKSLSPLLDAALEIQEFFAQRGWPFCFFGGIAVQHWGEQRFTRDADLTLYTGIGDEQSFIDAVLGAFAPRNAGARKFALRSRVLLIYARNGMPIDISLGALPFEQKAAAEARMQELAPGFKLRLCSPSALVVFKVFAGRPLDWTDVEGIIAKSGKRIDWADARSDLRELLSLKQDDESLARLEKLLSVYGY